MTVKHKVFIVADDASLRGLLTEQLQIAEEFVTEMAQSGADALARASDGFFDLILLDHQLPDMSGRELCRQLRDGGVKAPILLLSNAQSPNSADEETIEALDTLIKQGKVRYVGCSNYSGWHLMKALAIADAAHWQRFVSQQSYYSLLGREAEYELIPLGHDQGVGMLIWSPLAGGWLSGKYLEAICR